MARYNSTPLESIIDRRNSFLLRSDIHTLFDARKFAVVPKCASVDLEQPTLVVHAFVDEIQSEVVQLYHNVALQSLSGIAMEFLFARFAWTIFPFATVFLNGGVQRELQVRDQDGYCSRKFSEMQCREMARPGRSRSMSPKKQKPETEGSQGEVQDEDNFFEGNRGRKRRRPSRLSSRSASTISRNISVSNTDTDQSELGWESPSDGTMKESISRRSPNVDLEARESTVDVIGV
jgi:HNH endonuclease